MLSNWWLTSLSCLEVSTLLVSLMALCWRPAIRKQWPSLFVSLLVEFGSDMVLMTWLSNPRYKFQYFYTYWVSRAFIALLRLWTMADVMRSFPSLDFVPTKVYLFVGVAGATMATASAWYTFHTQVRLTMQVCNWAILLNQCVNVGWCAFAIAMLGAIKLFNFAWDERGAKITSCVFLRICVTYVAAELYAINSFNLRLVVNGIEIVCSVAFFLSLSYLFANPTPQWSIRKAEDAPETPWMFQPCLHSAAEKD